MTSHILFLTTIIFFFSLVSVNAQKVAVVDVQKVFDGYHKVKEAKERLEKSKKIAMEEIEIFRDEMEKIVKELKEMEEKLKNPNIESTALKTSYQQKVQKAKEKQDDMVQYDKRAKATIAQRQRNLLVEHLADIRAAVKKVAEAQKIDIILNGESLKFEYKLEGYAFKKLNETFEYTISNEKQNANVSFNLSLLENQNQINRLNSRILDLLIGFCLLRYFRKDAQCSAS